MKIKNLVMLLLPVIIFTVMLCCPVSVRAYDAPMIENTHEVKLRLVNNSGWLFKEISICPSSNTKWLENDIVTTYGGRKATLRNGQYMDIYPKIANRNEIRYWNIKIDYGKGGQKEFHDVDLFDFSRMEIGRNFNVGFQR